MANTVSMDVELKVPAKKLWDAIRDSGNILPKILPSQFKSIEVIEGDGDSVGSVRLIKYGEEMPMTFAKEKIEFVDQAAMTVTYSVVEGEVLSVYKIMKPTLKVVPGADANSCLAKWSFEFEAATEETPPTESAKAMALSTFKAMEGYLLATSP